MQRVKPDAPRGASAVDAPRRATIAYPAQNDPHAAFVAAVEEIENYAAGDPGECLRLIWPLWRQTSMLVVARHAVAACSRDFSWTFEACSTDIAKHIAASFDRFAELELEFDRGRIAKDAALAAPPRSSLHHSVLGVLIDPTEPDLIEDMILQLAEAGDENGLRHLVVLYRNALRDDDRLNSLFGKLRAAGRRLSPECLGILSDIPAHDAHGMPTSFGAALSAAILPRGDARPAPTNFSKHARRARAAVGDVRPRRRDKEERSAASIRLLETLASKLPARSTPIDRPHESGAETQSGRRPPPVSGSVSWLSLNLERSDWIAIGPESFHTDYGTRDSGAILSATHRVGQLFVYGPYVALQPGSYEVVFLGHMEGKAAAEFAVGVHKKAKTYARRSVTAASIAEGPGALCRLSFRVTEAVDLLEFVIRPTGRAGAISSRGIRLRRVGSG